VESRRTERRRSFGIHGCTEEGGSSTLRAGLVVTAAGQAGAKLVGRTGACNSGMVALSTEVESRLGLDPPQVRATGLFTYTLVDG
jgi:hypothetical protein